MGGAHILRTSAVVVVEADAKGSRRWPSLSLAHLRGWLWGYRVVNWISRTPKPFSKNGFPCLVYASHAMIFFLHADSFVFITGRGPIRWWWPSKFKQENQILIYQFYLGWIWWRTNWRLRANMEEWQSYDVRSKNDRILQHWEPILVPITKKMLQWWYSRFLDLIR